VDGGRGIDYVAFIIELLDIIPEFDDIREV